LQEVFGQQYQQKTGQLKPVKERATGAVQNPHDPDAQWSAKGKRKQKKTWVGYRAQVAERLPEKEAPNQKRFITSIVTQKASESDDPGLDQTFQDQALSGLERPTEFYVDGALPFGCSSSATQGTISELARAHGLRRSRYRGFAKVELQNLFIGTACNVKRWLRKVAETKIGPGNQLLLFRNALYRIQHFFWAPQVSFFPALVRNRPFSLQLNGHYPGSSAQSKIKDTSPMNCPAPRYVKVRTD
jgi:hypothetical protein